jgi:hypothetical protein
LVGEVENTPVPDSSSASEFFAERGWLGVFWLSVAARKKASGAKMKRHLVF